MFVRTLTRGSPRGSAPHTALDSRSVATVRTADSASTASNARNRPAGSSTGRPDTETRSGPSTSTVSTLPLPLVAGQFHRSDRTLPPACATLAIIAQPGSPREVEVSVSVLYMSMSLDGYI